MSNEIIKKEPTMEDMKNQIIKCGGSFYQYRGCRNSASIIYDIENIKHDVVFAQTPLNMNDPFDSVIGYSSEKIYEECIALILDAIDIDIDNNIKLIISVVLKYKLLGNIAGFLSSFNELKNYVISIRKSMHMNNIPYEVFVKNTIKKIYGKAPKIVKQFFPKELFILFGTLISAFEDNDITEDAIVSLLKLDTIIDELLDTIESVKTGTYINSLKDFLSKLTVSCFSTSGWDNQLMWAHYANSYSGICVEYDLTKIDEFIGFIYPVNYTNERPTISLKDLGIRIKRNNDGTELEQNEVDIVPIFNYLLCKNTCWEYEKEWRLINIGEPNTPISIKFPFIKSITLGLNIDNDTKRIILDICKSKNIDCYSLLIDFENYSLDRLLVSDDETIYDEDLEIQSLLLLADHIAYLSNYLDKKEEENVTADKISENSFDYKQAIDILEKVVDMLKDAYRFKVIFNKIICNTEENVSEITKDENIVNMIKSINELTTEAKENSVSLQDTIENIRCMYVIPDREFKLLNQYINDLKCLSNTIEGIEWAIDIDIE